MCSLGFSFFKYFEIFLKMEDEYSNERNEEHGRCSTCNRYNTNYSWCQSCDPQLLTRGWTSGNEAIDELIKSSQLKATQYGSIFFLEWIPYSSLTDIREIGQGGFATVYKAKWINGFKHIGENNERRCADITVALKRLYNSQNITDDFLQEFKNYTKLHTRFGVVKTYGLTQDPETKEYIFVMKYFESGSLYDYITRESRNLNWKHKVNLLYDIIFGLSAIHDNNLVHHDFHSGNILIQKYDNKIRSCISDLGLSVPADYRATSDQTTTIGVLTYIAPEVLKGVPYTPKSDIYSFGVIMSVISTEQQPFNDVAHDIDLAIKICEGVRPGFSNNTPKNYIELAYRCMDADPKQRPTASEVKKIIWLWKDSFEDDFSSVYVEGDDGHGYSKEELDELPSIRKIFESMDTVDFGPSRITATIHPKAVYTSSLLQYPDLPEPVNSNPVTIVGNNNDSHQIDLFIPE